MIDSVEIYVCDLCLLAHEAPNGGSYTDDEERTALSEWSRRWPGYRFASTEDEGGFSWSACDGCGTTLGGNRYLASAVPESDPYDELPE